MLTQALRVLACATALLALAQVITARNKLCDTAMMGEIGAPNTIELPLVNKTIERGIKSLHVKEECPSELHPIPVGLNVTACDSVARPTLFMFSLNDIEVYRKGAEGVTTVSGTKTCLLDEAPGSNEKKESESV